MLLSAKPWSEVRDAIARLRVEVWKPLTTPGNRGLQMDSLEEPLDNDPRTVHFACIENGEVIAAARLTLDYLPQSISKRCDVNGVQHHAFFSRLVVREKHRRQGIGMQLQAARVDYARAHGQSAVWAEATTGSVKILSSQGFEVVARYFEDEAIFVRCDIAIMCKKLV